MINKRCSFVMEDGHKCNRPFSDRTGKVSHRLCEEHRLKKNKQTGLVRDTSGVGSPYVQITNAKLMQEWVETQMQELPNLIAKIEQLEEKVDSAAKTPSPEAIPTIGDSIETKNRFLTSNAFRNSIDSKVEDAILLAITKDETFQSKVMGTIAVLNSRMASSTKKMMDVNDVTSPRITELSEKLKRMEKLMETIEFQQIELAALLKREKRNVKRRLEYKGNSVGVAELEEE